MLLWRVFPFREDARSASEPGHPLYLNPRQGTGRWDNPHLTALMYLAEQPSGAVGEAFANLTSWSPRMFSFPMIPGAVRRLGTYRVDEAGHPACDLDDPNTLVRLAVRPTQVVARNRPFTQGLAARIHAEQAWAGIRWWSYHRPQWTLRALWDRATLTCESVEDLDDHPALDDAAAELAKHRLDA